MGVSYLELVFSVFAQRAMVLKWKKRSSFDFRMIDDFVLASQPSGYDGKEVRTR